MRQATLWFFLLCLTLSSSAQNVRSDEAYRRAIMVESLFGELDQSIRFRKSHGVTASTTAHIFPDSSWSINSM